VVKRLVAIALIFAVTTAAWLLLGATIFQRTQSSDQYLRGRVGSTWGTAQSQQAPTAFIERLEQRVAEAPRRPPPGRDITTATTSTEDPRSETVRVRVPLSLEQTRAAVAFDLDHRQKGLLWYSTYGVTFTGAFNFRNTTNSDAVMLEFPLPTSQAIYDGLKVNVNGAPAPFEMRDQRILAAARVPVGSTVMLGVSYRSQGLDQWRYALGPDVAQVRDFELAMTTDFEDIDFPESTLSPTEKRRVGEGWELKWDYTNLLSGFQIGMDMPEKLQPGPLAGEISLFAPVSLLFFFAVIFLITTIRGIEIHPMNYLFLAAAFFSFHLLLAYLVDHVSIHIAFIIASAVSIFLVVSYMRLAVGSRFAFREVALAQLIYLVLFSYAFFFKGFTGLAITIGSIVTLFVAMQLTGRIRWSEVFSEGSGAKR
jgi:hypothetical protein